MTYICRPDRVCVLEAKQMTVKVENGRTVEQVVAERVICFLKVVCTRVEDNVATEENEKIQDDLAKNFIITHKNQGIYKYRLISAIFYIWKNLMHCLTCDSVYISVERLGYDSKQSLATSCLLYFFFYIINRPFAPVGLWRHRWTCLARYLPRFFRFL